MSFFSRVAKAFRFGRHKHFVGKDLDSNYYYELPSLDGSLDPRKTRRLIRYRVHQELGEHDQSKLPVQWLMWLRHTRKSVPTIDELLQDKERIETTRHNARILEAKDVERRLQLEQKAAEETRAAQHYLEPTSSQTAGPSQARAPQGTLVSGETLEQDGQQSKRNVDMEVWEASRKRVEEQNAQQADPFLRRAHKRSQMDAQDAERERRRRAMTRSPLEDYDVTYVGEEGAAAAPAQQQQEEQLQQRFGRSVGPGEQWSPQEWTPTPRR